MRFCLCPPPPLGPLCPTSDPPHPRNRREKIPRHRDPRRDRRSLKRDRFPPPPPPPPRVFTRVGKRRLSAKSFVLHFRLRMLQVFLCCLSFLFIYLFFWVYFLIGEIFILWFVEEFLSFKNFPFQELLKVSRNDLDFCKLSSKRVLSTSWKILILISWNNQSIFPVNRRKNFSNWFL